MTNNPQIVGNMGLYLACYELSKAGWNVMPTSRNAKGVDLIAYKGKSGNKGNFWLWQKRYMIPEFESRWDRIQNRMNGIQEPMFRIPMAMMFLLKQMKCNALFL